VRRSLSAVATAGLLLGVPVTAAAAGAAAASCGDWGCPDDQPRLSRPVPPAEPAGAWGDEDWDHDGIPNRLDNCPLVPNPDQQPAVRPAGAVLDPLAVQWKAAHPNSPFRTADQLGEACSDWNGNWHRTEEAQILAPEEVKRQLFGWEGEGGPMFGPDTLVYGGPVCTDMNVWPRMGEYYFGSPEYEFPTPAEFGCPDGGFSRPGEDFVAANIWGGKRLFTPTNAGGQITNRFFPSVSESPVAEPMLPYAPDQWFPHQHPQTVLGHVIRGRSYVDGRSAIILDWRANSGENFGGYPIANTGMPGFGQFLVYDECRGLQEGVWTCNANADIVRSSTDRKLFQFAWMMFQKLDPSIPGWKAWEAANPQWSNATDYGFIR
jgi:hypothetical protein